MVGTGAVIGMISTLLVMLYGQIRIFMVMSRDGLLPKMFSKIHPVHKTPTLCTIITGLIAAVMGVPAAITGMAITAMVIRRARTGAAATGVAASGRALITV